MRCEETVTKIRGFFCPTIEIYARLGCSWSILWKNIKSNI